MKNNIILISISLIFLGIISCEKNNLAVIEGEVFIKLIKPNTQYEVTDSMGNKINLLNTLIKKKQLSKSENELMNFYTIIRDNKLQDFKQINVKLKHSGEMILVFLRDEDIALFGDMSTQRLKRDSIVKSVIFRGEELSNQIYLLEEIIAIEDKKGETYVVK